MTPANEYTILRYVSETVQTNAAGQHECRTKASISMNYGEDGASGEFGDTLNVCPPSVLTKLVSVYLKYDLRVDVEAGGELVLDGRPTRTGDLVWLTNQGTDDENGIYRVSSSAWERVQPVNFDTIVDIGATAYDEVDGDITRDIVTTNDIDFSEPGSYFITYSVVNSSGVLTQVSRKVNVMYCESSIMPTHTENITDLKIVTETDEELFRSAVYKGDNDQCNNGCGSYSGELPTNDYVVNDGGSTFTGSQSMGGNRLTDLGNGTWPGDAISLDQMNLLTEIIREPLDLTIRAVAGKRLVPGTVVKIGDDKRFYPANSSLRYECNEAVAIATETTDIGEVATCTFYGYADGMSGLVPGERYYFDENGMVTTEAPEHGYSECVGTAISETAMNVRMHYGICYPD